MMSRVDFLLESLDDTEVFFLEYTRIRSNKNAVFIIEGKDDPKFYTAKISSVMDSRWEAISVGGKSRVLELRQAIKTHKIYKNDSVYFLVDRDFDERIPDSDIYTTPTYSIENLYCNSETIKNLIVGECGLSNYKVKNRHEIIEYVISEYCSLQKKFHSNKKVKTANAIFMYVRRRCETKKISLDAILKLAVTIDDGKILIKLNKKREYGNLRCYEKDLFKCFLVDDTHFMDVMNNPGKRFRGKQEILFLREFVKHLKDDGYVSKRVEEKFSYKLKLENPSMSDHILSSLAQYVYTPKCLASFLELCRNDWRESVARNCA